MRIHRGNWSPLIPGIWRTLVVSIIPISPIVIGIDYLMGENSSSLSDVEKAAPIDVWGWLLILFGMTTLVGYAGAWRKIAIAGLWATGAVMITLSVGIASVMIDEVGGFRWPWLYLVIGLASWMAAIGYLIQGDGDGNGSK